MSMLVIYEALHMLALLVDGDGYQMLCFVEPPGFVAAAE
jgi:hypothetical protein